MKELVLWKQGKNIEAVIWHDTNPEFRSKVFTPEQLKDYAVKHKEYLLSNPEGNDYVFDVMDYVKEMRARYER